MSRYSAQLSWNWHETLDMHWLIGLEGLWTWPYLSQIVLNQNTASCHVEINPPFLHTWPDTLPDFSIFAPDRVINLSADPPLFLSHALISPAHIWILLSPLQSVKSKFCQCQSKVKTWNTKGQKKLLSVAQPILTERIRCSTITLRTADGWFLLAPCLQPSREQDWSIISLTNWLIQHSSDNSEKSKFITGSGTTNTVLATLQS